MKRSEPDTPGSPRISRNQTAAPDSSAAVEEKKGNPIQVNERARTQDEEGIKQRVAEISAPVPAVHGHAPVGEPPHNEPNYRVAVLPSQGDPSNSSNSSAEKWKLPQVFYLSQPGAEQALFQALELGETDITACVENSRQREEFFARAADSQTLICLTCSGPEDYEGYAGQSLFTLFGRNRLQTLKLENLSLNAQGWEEMETALATNTSLKKLMLSLPNLDAASAQGLVNGLIRNGNIQTLTLHIDQASEQTVGHLARLLESNQSVLRFELLIKEGGQDFLPRLMEGFRRNGRIVQLVIELFSERKTLQDSSASALVEALRCNPQLKRLDMPCRITLHSAGVLLDYLESAPLVMPARGLTVVYPAGQQALARETLRRLNLLKDVTQNLERMKDKAGKLLAADLKSHGLAHPAGQAGIVDATAQVRGGRDILLTLVCRDPEGREQFEPWATEGKLIPEGLEG